MRARIWGPESYTVLRERLKIINTKLGMNKEKIITKYIFKEIPGHHEIQKNNKIFY